MTTARIAFPSSIPWVFFPTIELLFKVIDWPGFWLPFTYDIQNSGGVLKCYTLKLMRHISSCSISLLLDVFFLFPSFPLPLIRYSCLCSHMWFLMANFLMLGIDAASRESSPTMYFLNPPISKLICSIILFPHIFFLIFKTHIQLCAFINVHTVTDFVFPHLSVYIFFPIPFPRLSFSLASLNFPQLSLHRLSSRLSWCFFFRSSSSFPWTFLLSQLSFINIGASFTGMGNIPAFKTMRTLRALRPLRALSRLQGMRVSNYYKGLTAAPLAVVYFCLLNLYFFCKRRSFSIFSAWWSFLNHFYLSSIVKKVYPVMND